MKTDLKKLDDIQLLGVLTVMTETLDHIQDFIEGNRLNLLDSTPVTRKLFEGYAFLRMLVLECYEREVIAFDAFVEARLAIDHVLAVRKIAKELKLMDKKEEEDG